MRALATHVRTGIALVCLGLWLAGVAWGSDLKREKAWADLLDGHLRQGHAVWLSAGGSQKVLAIDERAQTRPPKGGVILLHDMGEHPDWPQVIGPLRRALPRHGWATLSVQMPVLAAGAAPDRYAPLVAEAIPRLRAAVHYLNSRHISPIVLVGYGLGATMGAAYLAAQKPGPVRSFVGISMGMLNGAPEELNPAPYLAKLTVPALAVYGSRDYEWVVRSAPSLTAAAARNSADEASAAGGGPPAFRQIRIMGADHGYTGLTDDLTDDVLGWANRAANAKIGTR